jgi:hypothetical protein
MVEKEFRNGVVPISEYVRITTITAEAEVAFESVMSEFIIAKKTTEDTGLVFKKVEMKLIDFKFDIKAFNTIDSGSIATCCYGYSTYNEPFI